MAVDWLPEPGQTLDERYELAEQIGVGPTGAVYAAKRLEDGQEVVLKVFHPDLFAGQVRGPNTMRLQRARLMNAPGLITLEEIDVREGSAFVVMPRIDSVTLPEWVTREGQLSEERIRSLVQAVGATLEVIHQLGVHGDVKPSNIYVADDDSVIVSDPWFLEGLAGIRDAAGLAPRADAWLAPEQSEGLWQERPETDIYRLAMLAGWLLTGAEVEGGRSLREQGVSCSEELDAVFMRATQVDPGERFGQVRDFLDALPAVGWLPDAAAKGEPAKADHEALEGIDPLAETIGQGVASPLASEANTTAEAQFLDEEQAVDLSDDPADETLEDATPGPAEAEGGDGADSDAEDEEDPAATRVLRQESLESGSEEPVEPALEADPQPEPEVEAEVASADVPPADEPAESGADEFETVVGADIAQSLDALADSSSPAPPAEGPERFATVRDVPEATLPELQPEEGPGDADLSMTRKQPAPELAPHWRTNPIMIIGPAMLVLSLIVALSVLNKIQDDRKSAAAHTSVGEASEKAAPQPTSPAPGQPAEALPAKAASSSASSPPSPGSKPAPAPTPPKSDEATGKSEPSESANEAAEDGARPDPGATTKDGPVTANGDDYRSLKCPPNMIRVRRSKKKAAGATESKMEVWCIDRYEFPGKGRTPRTGVGVVKAERLCAERGYRLCTRREWGIACGGKYPYKGEYDPDACNSAAPGPTPRSVKPAGSKLRCVSGWGAYDMVGNVAEWTSDGKVNGGSARGDAEGGTCYRSIPRKSGGSDVGFRCCAEPTRTEPPK